MAWRVRVTLAAVWIAVELRVDTIRGTGVSRMPFTLYLGTPSRCVGCGRSGSGKVGFVAARSSPETLEWLQTADAYLSPM